MHLVRGLVPNAIKARIRRYYEGRFKRETGIRTMADSLTHLRTIGFQPRTAIDVGAYEGEWAALCRSVFPDCAVLMIEPQQSKQRSLHEMAAAGPMLSFVGALLGAQPRDDVDFFEDETASSVLPDSENHRKAPSRFSLSTLSAVTSGTAYASPDLIKLDVQGYELEVLKGGIPQLRSAGVVILEVSIIEIYRGSPLLYEVVDFMKRHDFVAYDIAGLVRRPLDSALAQIDMVFVSTSSPLISSRLWG